MDREQAKKHSLQALSELTNSRLIGDPDYLISGVDGLEWAGSEDASFLANPRYRETMLSSQAGMVCIDAQTEQVPGKNYLVSDNPSRAFQTIVELFLIDENRSSGFLGIHPTAVIHPSVKIGKNVHIGPYAVLDKGSSVGDDTRIMAFVSIGYGVSIGDQCLLYPHVVVREKCTIGNRVTLQPGAVIGSCGFGYTTDNQGAHTKLEQVGGIIIEDDVEIGANTTIDRARFKATRIGRGTKIDNLVQIGHNVTIGPHNIIVSQTGIAGSSKTGRNVVFGGQAGVVGHVEIADFAIIATRGGISKSVTKAGKYAGSPIMPLSQYNRQQVQLRKIEDYVKKIEELEKRLQVLEKQNSCEPVST